MAGDGGTMESIGPDETEEESHEAYFQELNDGCGCAEIWEYLSERRRRDRSAASRE